MTQYLKGKKEDIADIIDFGNYIFSQNHSPHDFKELLPKLYCDRYNTAQHHYLVKEDGKIKAMILAMPSQVKIGESVLDICGIGTVSVHPYSRGSGYMKELMTMAVEDMKKNGVHFSILGGQRQRYEYFGYEPCGMQVNFDVISANVKHAFRGLDCSNITFEEVKLQDSDKIKQAYDLFQTKKARGVRPLDEFYDIARTWKNKLYSINLGGSYLGYVAINNNSIGELMLNDNTKLANVVTAIFAFKGIDSLTIGIPFYEQEELAFFSGIAEHYSINQNHCINIFDYKTVIKAYMELKASYSSLADGKLAIKIDNETIQICVTDNHVTVERYDGQPDVCMSHLDAIMHIFSPAGGFLKNSVMKNEAANTWFPLPIYLSGLDCV